MTTLPRVPIPANGVDYRGKVVLAPMVRSGELPCRLLALKYGADLVWGPETIDRALAGAKRRVNPRNGTIEFTRTPSNGGRVEKATKESVIYRLDPVREKGKLIFQIGTATPDLAVAAAKLVAPDVAGIDVNSGCPKPFSTSGGMGAALLRTPDKLVSILETLVREVGTPYQIGISVKIRLLDKQDPEPTRALVERLVRTGITGLTVHCRTPPMRPRERAIRDQLRMVRDICHEAGVACLVNGDVANKDDGLALMQEYGVDGAMIATAAEANLSAFRTAAEGGLLPWKEMVRDYMQACLECENRFGNTKYLLNIFVPGKAPESHRAKTARTYVDTCLALGFEDMIPAATRVDEILGLSAKSTATTTAEKNDDDPVSKAVHNALEKNESARAAGGASRSKPTSPVLSHSAGGPVRTNSIPRPTKSAPNNPAEVDPVVLAAEASAAAAAPKELAA
ncbi:tRNA-dihydrouridine(20) synthase (NAD(+)) [Aspergillus saccharolyticus JOP 1030-1]|uniref:tRNA dihydrouridine synthase n=1 Tax=Aspergillus saccharolyticus JOP 1030-1 TaxID=1450539 RepID=A0A318ZV63_9EURO|nr:tRNA dihydrouridine synthase [Aspergillus saccharolyticus JOP 1030-1]PYH47930.1 tRNA dihydrouridine synthase [Aspergillus saccharolyticus JOP 1030-1]